MPWGSQGRVPIWTYGGIQGDPETRLSKRGGADVVSVTLASNLQDKPKRLLLSLGY